MQGDDVARKNRLWSLKLGLRPTAWGRVEIGVLYACTLLAHTRVTFRPTIRSAMVVPAWSVSGIVCLNFPRSEVHWLSY